MGMWPVSIGSESRGLSLKSQSPVAGDARSVSNRAVLGLLKALCRGLCEHVCVRNRLMRVWRRGWQAEIELKGPLGSEVDQELGSAHLGVRVPPSSPSHCPHPLFSHETGPGLQALGQA